MWPSAELGCLGSILRVSEPHTRTVGLPNRLPFASICQQLLLSLELGLAFAPQCGMGLEEGEGASRGLGHVDEHNSPHPVHPLGLLRCQPQNSARGFRLVSHAELPRVWVAPEPSTCDAHHPPPAADGRAATGVGCCRDDEGRGPAMPSRTLSCVETAPDAVRHAIP